MAKVSQAVEDYLKAIYVETEENEREATVHVVAARLGVAKPSVTKMVKRLCELGLVESEAYGAARLTQRGRVIALEVVRHHRLIEMFLVDALGMSWDEIHAEAEVLEHHISEGLEARMAELLGHPRFDPHGHPIPDLQGNLPESELRPLSALQAGEAGVVRRVCDGEAEVLRYLAQIGITLERTVRVKSRAPFDGPLVVVTEDGEVHALGESIARLIEVAA